MNPFKPKHEVEILFKGSSEAASELFDFYCRFRYSVRLYDGKKNEYSHCVDSKGSVIITVVKDTFIYDSWEKFKCLEPSK